MKLQYHQGWWKITNKFGKSRYTRSLSDAMAIIENYKTLFYKPI